MKRLLILFLSLSFFISCETAKEKEERLFGELVTSSDEFRKPIEDMLFLKGELNAAKMGVISETAYLNKYNVKCSDVLKFANDLNTVKQELDKKSQLYIKYRHAEAFLLYSEDSVRINKYKKERDRILELIKSK